MHAVGTAPPRCHRVAALIVTLGLAIFASAGMADERPGAPPWPCRDGGPEGGRVAATPGAVHGRVIARWTAPKGSRLWSGPVVGRGNRIALALDREVLVFGRDLRPASIAVAAARTVAATADGGLLAATATASFRVGADLSVRALDLRGPFGGKAPEGVMELPGGDLLAWRGKAFARLAPSLEARFRHDPDQGFIATLRVACGPDGMLYTAMATSYTGEDEPTEYYGVLRGYSAAGKLAFERTHATDRLPTDTGLDVRLMARRGGVVLAECGAALFDAAGAERWRERPPPPRRDEFVAFPGGSLVYAEGGHRLVRQDLSAATGAPPPAPQTLLEVPPDDWIGAVAGDGAGRVYAALKRAVVAVDLDGKTVFRVDGVAAERLVVGDGIVVVLARPLELIAIE